MASGEYVIRKPDRMLFETALRKAKLSADFVWYCGDDIEADVKGAHGAGIYPALYRGNIPDEGNTFAGQSGDTADLNFDYLPIRDWSEQTTLLESMAK